VEATLTTEQASGFEAFFAETWPDLVAYCHTLTRDGALAEELTQEALTRVFVRFPLLREPRPYAFRVATNLVRAHWRSRTSALVDDGVVPAHDVATLDAVRRLAPRLRDPVLLHYYADLPLADVARQLKRPLGTIKRRLHEARAQLSQDLGRDPS
jgi:RNA polymerase sigma-70 factor (ECF subfamily)